MISAVDMVASDLRKDAELERISARPQASKKDPCPKAQAHYYQGNKNNTRLICKYCRKSIPVPVFTDAYFSIARKRRTKGVTNDKN